MLQFVYNIDFAKFISNIKKIILAEDLDRALSLCKSVSHTSLAKISLKAIEAAETDPTTVKGTIEEETIDFLPKLESRINALPAFATLILLVGILGTIDSLWVSFESIEILDTAEKQARLAKGIASSLNPTSLGLIICMAFIAGYQIAKGMAIRLTEKIHLGVSVLNNLLVPEEVAYVSAPINAGTHVAAPTPSSAPKEETGSTESAPHSVEADDANFDDASVEDIKDEEEII
ncbi:MAG: MotA/TolQ/ExbB proton channel family protein [Oligoflexales bacterium]|nr:MotA/TolQ/ExbB proton channel family protein [Oligoflexales bacterium]